MTSRLLLPAALRHYADEQAEVEIHGGTLGAALDDLAERLPQLERRLRDEQGQLRPHVLMFVDGVSVRSGAPMETPVGDGAEVFVAPAVSGGSSGVDRSMSAERRHSLDVEGIGPVEVTVSDDGSGHTFLILHGGAGPQSVAGFAGLLVATRSARVIAPTHPGFSATPRPEGLDSVPGLARVYVALLDRLDIEDVTVIGSSVGGWVAAEMALLASPRVASLILVDAVGIEVAGHPVVDFFALNLNQVAELSYHDPDRFRIDPTTMSDAQRAVFAGNRSTLATYAGTSMSDPSLVGRLAAVAVPTLVVWGDSDGVVDQDYGRAYAAAIPGATFLLLTDTGHLPQIETPEQVLAPVWDFAEANARLRDTRA